jgi:hypothetical protein
MLLLQAKQSHALCEAQLVEVTAALSAEVRSCLLRLGTVCVSGAVYNALLVRSKLRINEK